MRLVRRIRLAYDLLRECERESEPIDIDEALRKIREYGAAHLHPVNAGPTWKEAVLEKMKEWYA